MASGTAALPSVDVLHGCDRGAIPGTDAGRMACPANGRRSAEGRSWPGVPPSRCRQGRPRRSPTTLPDISWAQRCACEGSRHRRRRLHRQSRGAGAEPGRAPAARARQPGVRPRPDRARGPWGAAGGRPGGRHCAGAVPAAGNPSGAAGHTPRGPPDRGGASLRRLRLRGRICERSGPLLSQQPWRYADAAGGSG